MVCIAALIGAKTVVKSTASALGGTSVDIAATPMPCALQRSATGSALLAGVARW